MNYNKSSISKFGGNSPLENLTSINGLSLVGAVFSVLAAIWMYLTRFEIPFVLFFGAAILLCNAAWHFSNFFVGFKLKRRLKTASKDSSQSQNQIASAKTKEFLPEANFENLIPKSVTENTTKELIKLNRKSS